MSHKFTKKSKGGQPAISTAALPDIVFMLLFFFLIASSVKSSNYEKYIKVEKPKASELYTLDKKESAEYIYVGKPNERYAGQIPDPAIIIDDDVVKIEDINRYSAAWFGDRNPADWGELTVLITMDKSIPYGVLFDLKSELGRNNLQNVIYTAQKNRASN